MQETEFYANLHLFHKQSFPGDVSPSPLPFFTLEDAKKAKILTARIFNTSYFGPDFWAKAFQKIQDWVTSGKWPRGFGKARRRWFEIVAPHISYALMEYRGWQAGQYDIRSRVVLIAPDVTGWLEVAAPDNSHWDIVIREVRADLDPEARGDAILCLRDHCYAISALVEGGATTPLEVDYLRSWAEKILGRLR